MAKPFFFYFSLNLFYVNNQKFCQCFFLVLYTPYHIFVFKSYILAFKAIWRQIKIMSWISSNIYWQRSPSFKVCHSKNTQLFVYSQNLPKLALFDKNSQNNSNDLYSTWISASIFLLHKKRFPGIFFTRDLFGVKSRQIMDFIFPYLFDIRFQYQKHVLTIIGKSSTFSALYRYPI